MRIIEDGRDIEGIGIFEGVWPFRDHETLANLGNFGGSNWCLRLWWFGSLGDIWLWGGGGGGGVRRSGSLV